MSQDKYKIEIRTIPNRGGIRNFSEDLEFFSQSHILSPLVNPHTRKYQTGLTANDVTFLKDKGFPYNIDDEFFQGKAHEFWESSLVKVVLSNTPTFLFPNDNLLDFVKYKFLRQSSFIYQSEEEMNTGSKPQATHYIYDESESTTIKATKLQRRNNLINKISKLSVEKKRDLILLLLNEVTINKGEDFLTVKFDEILDKTSLANSLEDLLNKKPQELNLLVDVRKAIIHDIFTKTRGGIFYFETNLGFTEGEVRETLEKAENQQLLLNIKDKLNKLNNINNL